MKIFYDEAGRGPLAGPVSIGLVYIKNYCPTTCAILQDVKDSKQLSAKQREALYTRITTCPSIIYAHCFAHAKYIDQKGIIAAIHNAIVMGYKQLSHTNTTKDLRTRLHLNKVVGYFDGNHSFAIDTKYNIPIHTIIKGDQKIAEISMASILAKVYRDAYMTNIAKKYPLYGFAHHKGYGTKQHISAIQCYGLSPIHRATYCKNITYTY